MKSINIKKLYKLHSWVGIITGILLFIIAFSGAVAVFARPELKIWANQEIRTPVKSQPDAYQALINRYARQVDPVFREEIHILLPDPRTSEFMRVIFEGHIKQEDGSERHQGIVYEFDPVNLQEISKSDMDTYFDHPKYDMANFLADFHADLHLGRPVGLILTGLLGLTLLVSIITGILVHRKILSQLFTFRPGRSLSLWLNDGHKAMGIWGVMFHSVIAFTGAFLGLATVILVPAAAYVSFNGDQEKLLEALTAVKAPQIAQVEQPTQLADILRQSATQYPELEVTNLSIMGLNDKNALVYLYAAGGDKLGGQILQYQGATAEFVKVESFYGRLEGVTGKILDAMFPLHFGNFGGVFVKTLWSWLGIATALLPISGIMLWIERGLTAPHPAHSRATYNATLRLVIGACGGIVCATAMLFPGQLLLDYQTPGGDHTDAIFLLFFVSWIGAFMVGLLIKPKQSVPLIGYLTVLCLLLTMPMDIFLTDSHVFQLASAGHYETVGVDLTLFVLGIVLAVLLTRGTRQGQVHIKKSKTVESQSLAQEH